MKNKNVRTNNVKRVQKNSENTPKEVTEILRVKKKYNFKHIMLCNLMELHIIFIFLILCFILTKQLLTVVAVVVLYIAILFIALVLYKKSAINTYVSFQEDKVVYRRKFLFINKREEMRYNEIKEITFQYETGAYFRFWQKRNNLGNMTIYPKKGNVLIHGIEINNIAPFDKIMIDVKNNIGDKIK